VRFYIEKNLESIFTCWAKQRNNHPLPPDVDLAKLLPILQQASMQSDEKLHKRWAALLETAVTAPNDVLPSFATTLSQLSADEAQYLERLYVTVEERGTHTLGPLEAIRYEYDSRVGYYPVGLLPVEDAELDKLFAHANLVIQDLERLGLLTTVAQTVRETHGAGVKPPIKLDIKYASTEYGLKFIRAVSLTNGTEE
jgi:hypothetical protein